MAEPFEGEIRIVGAMESANQVDSLEKSVRRFNQTTGSTSRQTGKASRFFQKFGKSNKELGRSIGGTINEVSELGLGFAALAPQARQLGIAFAGAGNTAVTLGGSMGPIGAIVGTLIATVPSLVAQFVDLSGSMSDSATQAEKFLDAISKTSKTLKAIREEEEIRAGGAAVQKQAAALVAAQEEVLRIQKEISEVERGQRTGGGLLGGDPSDLGKLIELKRELKAAKEEAKKLDRALRRSEADVAPGLPTTPEARRAALRAGEADIARSAAIGAEAANDNENVTTAGGRGGSSSRQRRAPLAGGTSETTPGETLDTIGAILDMEREREDTARRLATIHERDAEAIASMHERQEGLSSEILRTRDHAALLNDEQLSLAEQARRAAREVRQAAQTAQEKAEEQREQEKRRIDAAFAETTSLISGLTEALISGEEGAIKSYLKAQAKRWGLEALEQTALGISKLLVPGRQAEAANHFVSAGMFGGLAAAAGAGSAAASGGGGGQAQEGGSGPGQRPESTGGAGQGGGGTTIVNVNSPVPEVELGRTIERARRAAQRAGVAA